ncbi:phage tail tube protein [Gilliamella sp. ESL0250]|uniref:phage tail tube protein n=1 Tax=Gilliamella sp. ESL0250 TaxID=2705036 RepID=UPI0015806C70|nr:phage tail tube protein [Gilliamella sp. ESL0250]NUF48729.1 hypothetical protein [Gilliamella sp. ESL0250]
MTCKNKTIDSNVAGLYIANEDCLKILPDNPVWHGIEVNSYSDLGGSTTLLQRETINPSRQNQKGKIVDLDANAGFSLDFTKNILTWLMQGFMFADAREKFTTKPLDGIQNKIMSIDSDGYNLETPCVNPPIKGMLISASGFDKHKNNGIKVIKSATASKIIVNGGLAENTLVNDNAKLTAVGFKFQAGECSIVANGGGFPSLVTTKTKVTSLNLTLGEWIFLGGDTSNSSFKKNKGWARITAISDYSLTFDDTDFTPIDENNNNLELELYFGTVIKNESRQDLIKKRSYCIERTLGDDGNGLQAQYVTGAVANEIKFNLSTAQYITCDLSYVACGSLTKKGGERLDGVRLVADKSEAYNTTSNIYRQKLSVIDKTSSIPQTLFAYVTDSNLSISNGVTGIKALGILGSFDVSVGNFNVTGSLTAFFSSVAAIEAIKNNADVGFSTILASNNAGAIFDIPLLALSGGMPNVEKDQKITIPLEKTGAENKHGYTMMYQSFEYLPDIAMPVAND